MRVNLVEEPCSSSCRWIFSVKNSDKPTVHYLNSTKQKTDKVGVAGEHSEHRARYISQELVERRRINVGLTHNSGTDHSSVEVLENTQPCACDCTVVLIMQTAIKYINFRGFTRVLYVLLLQIHISIKYFPFTSAFYS